MLNKRAVEIPKKGKENETDFIGKVYKQNKKLDKLNSNTPKTFTWSLLNQKNVKKKKFRIKRRTEKSTTQA